MQQTIGELLLESGNPLLKMWNVQIEERVREYVRHSHTRFEITVVNSGTGEYTTEKAVYPVMPGDVFVFSSNEAHSLTRIDKGGLSITNLHFEPRYLSEDFSESFGDSYINFCFYHAEGFSNRIPRENSEILRLHHGMIKNELIAEGVQYSLAIKAHLHLILVDLLRNHGYRGHIHADKGNDILAVYDYIDAHLGEEITLKELAEIANLSPNYFSHIFKEVNGISLWDYVTARRIEKATRLILSKNKKTMLDIALECGFNTTVNFNKAFKKHKGFTPSELRKDSKLLAH